MNTIKTVYIDKRVIHYGKMMKEDRRWEEERRHDVWRQERQCNKQLKSPNVCLSIP